MKVTYLKDLALMFYGLAKSKIFVNFKTFNRKVENLKGVSSLAFKSPEEGKIAIVIQGNTQGIESFVLDTIRIYKRLFPSAQLILSTWECSEIMSRVLIDLQVYLVLNKRPEVNGLANINLQICSTYGGVNKAKELGASFVLKSRTDQRFYNPFTLNYLITLLRSFPILNTSDLPLGRIIGVSLGTYKYRLYGLSDMFLFGHTADLVNYWSLNYDKRTPDLFPVGSEQLTWREQYAHELPEAILMKSYLMKIGHKVAGSLKDSWDAFSKYFLIIDSFAIDLYWHKYTINFDRSTRFIFDKNELTFYDWLALKDIIELDLIDEKILDEKIYSN